jgi:hypothetical protein
MRGQRHANLAQSMKQAPQRARPASQHMPRVFMRRRQRQVHRALDGGYVFIAQFEHFYLP